VYSRVTPRVQSAFRDLMTHGILHWKYTLKAISAQLESIMTENAFSRACTHTTGSDATWYASLSEVVGER
jgi:hypothetical protein